MWRIQDGELVIRPHPGQWQALDAPERFVFVLAAPQSGKTALGPPWLDRAIQQYGAGDYLAITATYDLFKLKMLPELLRYFCEARGIGEYLASDRIIALRQPPGTRIILRSAESPGGLESATALAAWVDECGQPSFDLQTWEAVTRRLTRSMGPVLGTTTIYHLGWLTDLYSECQAGKHPDMRFVRYNALDCPGYPVAEYERARRDMQDWRFRMMYEADADVRPAGLIYSDYNPLHHIAAFPIPDDWKRYVGMDPGGANTGVIWVAEAPPEQGDDPFGSLYYVYHELMTGDLSTPELVEKVTSYDPLVSQYWGGAHSESQVRRDWTAAGRYLYEPPVADVEQGISRVVKLFRGNSLYVFDCCTGLHRQLNSYSRKLAPDGTPTDEIADKASYHLLDALRYLAGGLGQRIVLPRAQHRPVYVRGH